MSNYYWNDWYAGWGWFLWFGICFLLISSFGNWGYTYRVHRKYGDIPRRDPIDILNERYARGEIKQDEYLQKKSDLEKPVKRQETKGLSQIVPKMDGVY